MHGRYSMVRLYDDAIPLLLLFLLALGELLPVLFPS